MLLEGKIAIVTGGSQGIGKAIAKLFSQEGALVVICARNEQKTALVAHEMEIETGRKVTAMTCDVSRKDEVDSVIDRVMDLYGRIDILVNNAAIQDFAPFLDITEEAWDRHFAINVKGVFLFAQGVARKMMHLGGCKIINMSSDSGVTAVPDNAGAYCSTKSAIIGLTRVIAKSLGQYGIYCNAVCPGGIAGTGMKDNYDRIFGDRDNEDVALTALKRLGSVEDVASAVLFFASKLSNHVTGERLLVTGGDVMTQ